MVLLFDWMWVFFCYCFILFFVFYVYILLIRVEILIFCDKVLVMGWYLFKIDFFFQIELKYMIFFLFFIIF